MKKIPVFFLLSVLSAVIIFSACAKTSPSSPVSVIPPDESQLVKWHQISDTAAPEGLPANSTKDLYYFGKGTNGGYDNGQIVSGDVIVGPFFVNSAKPYFSFYSWQETEKLSAYDHCNVYVSSDGGFTWINLVELLAEFNKENEWYQVSIDMSAYTNQTLLFKFRFDSVDDEVNDYLGWYFDGVQFLPAPTAYLVSSDS